MLTNSTFRYTLLFASMLLASLLTHGQSAANRAYLDMTVPQVQANMAPRASTYRFVKKDKTPAGSKLSYVHAKKDKGLPFNTPEGLDFYFDESGHCVEAHELFTTCSDDDKLSIQDRILSSSLQVREMPMPPPDVAIPGVTHYYMVKANAKGGACLCNLVFIGERDRDCVLKVIHVQSAMVGKYLAAAEKEELSGD